MTVAAWTAAGIFVVVYILIASERFDKTKLALAGGALMIILGVVDQHTAFHGSHGVEGIDWNTLFLLMGMMIIVNVTRHTGLFEWLAIKTAKAGRGRPVPILVGMTIVTAVLSALLDNVTTVLLIAPTIIVIYEALELDPVPFLIFAILLHLHDQPDILFINHITDTLFLDLPGHFLILLIPGEFFKMFLEVL